MIDNFINQTKDFYNHSYNQLGFKAQRRYPNEEFCRFMGRNFLDKDISINERAKIKILETGCGSGANLWMVAKEGFDAYGIDFSSDAILLAEKMMSLHGITAKLAVQNMCELDFADNFFDAVFDVFSSYCLTLKQSDKYLKRVVKILKPKGLFFSYFPCKMSDTYTFSGGEEFIDSSTLKRISRKDSPFYGQEYPFLFIHPREYEEKLKLLGLDVQYLEVVNKTYKNRQENFSFVVIEAKK